MNWLEEALRERGLSFSEDTLGMAFWEADYYLKLVEAGSEKSNTWLLEGGGWNSDGLMSEFWIVFSLWCETFLFQSQFFGSKEIFLFGVKECIRVLPPSPLPLLGREEKKDFDSRRKLEKLKIVTRKNSQAHTPQKKPGEKEKRLTQTAKNPQTNSLGVGPFPERKKKREKRKREKRRKETREKLERQKHQGEDSQKREGKRGS